MEMKQIKQYRSVIKGIDETKGVVIIAANAFNNVDSQGDVSMPGSFAKTIENIKNIYWYKNHNDNETLGVIQRLWEDDLYLNAELHFNLEKEFSRNMYSDYKFFKEKNNEIKHSVGVSVISDKVEYLNEIRQVKEWKLWEISSLTKWPANELAGTHEVKSLEHLKTIKEYYEWMSNKGLHTDVFIRQTEDLLKELQLQQIEPVIEPLKNTKEPELSTLIKNINEIKI